MSARAVTSANARAVFLEGSILHHVLRMSAAGAVGLIAIFIVDLLSLIYISWLGNASLTAGVGYASQLSFFIISINVGLLIGTGALVSQAIGRGDRSGAERLAVSCMIHVCAISFMLSMIALPFARPILALMGAKGPALDAAVQFSIITLPSTALLAAGMAATGILRAVGDARRSMYCTLVAAAIACVLDPLFILVMRWDVAGAAWATVFARCGICVAGLWYVRHVHHMLKAPQWSAMGRDLRLLLAIAIPAIVTNLASPVATTWMLRVFSEFGEQVVAGVAMVDRLIPVAFGLLFAMSGAVGPIIGQNFGAKNFRRIRETLTSCFKVAVIYVGAVWIMLAVFAPQIARAFGASGDAADFLIFFCRYGTAAWMCLGCLFAANAAFNNLGFPLWATAFNWGRATLGTIPFVSIGAAWGGPQGGILGMTLGAFVVGVASVFVSYWLVRRLEKASTKAV